MLKTLARRTAIALAVPAAAFGLAIGAVPATAASAATATTVLEAQVMAQTNQQRAKVGCRPLSYNAALTNAARWHSRDMAKYNYFSHVGRDGSSFSTRARRAGYSAPVGENIAWGYSSSTAVMTGWMNSAGHRKNILNCKATKIGVGAARNAKGTLYWTQEFGA